MLFFYLIIFIFGTAIGSFLNSIAYRLEKGESFLRGRSYCPGCKHELVWYDLMPLFSFLFLRGKCRYCAIKISSRYPLVELATGILFVLIFNFQFPTSNELLIFNFQALFSIFYFLIIACFLVVIFIYDLRHCIIPDGAIYSAIAISGIWYFVSGVFFDAYTKYEILNIIYGALGASAFFLAIFLVSRGKWLGFGDVKLAFFMGLFLGYPNILAALFLAFFAGAIIGIALMISGKKELKSEVPFGPFLIFGTFFSLFWGDSLVNWYLGLITV